MARLSRVDDPRRFTSYSYPHSQLSEELLLMYEELDRFSRVAASRYEASASLVNPALEVRQSLRNLTKAEYSFNETLPPYLRLGNSQVTAKDTGKLVEEFNRRKPELEQKARDFKPQ